MTHDASRQSPGPWSGRGRLGALVLLLYGCVLFAFRPATPFEWDEVLALSGVVKYDVAAHSPQPPGYPAYIGAAKAVRLLVGDPLLALQIVGILAALGALAATWALARRLGAPPLVSAAAAALVGANPEFLYGAAVGISDVPGAAAGVAAVLALAAAAENPALLPVAGAACGLVFGIRPQTATLLVPAVAWASFAAVRSGRRRDLVLGALTGVATAAACWVPAIVVTGPQRWWGAVVGQMRFVEVSEHTLHLPAAEFPDILRYWFLQSFVNWQFAAPMWALVVAGTVVLVRTGRGRLAALAGSTAAVYLLGAFFSMNEATSLRYMLPALPFLAVLAAGGAAAPHRVARRTFATLLALWCLVAVAWTSPALRERRRPAPVWAALTWIRQKCDPATTRVLYDVTETPHVDYVLRKAGFSVFEIEKASIPDHFAEAGERTLVVTPFPVPGAEVLFQAHHRTGRVVQLAWGRYGSCAVSQVRLTREAVYSPEWRLAKGGWRLRGTGRIALPEESKPAIVRLCAGAETITLELPGGPPETIAPRECVVGRLVPGADNVLTVTAPADCAAVVPPIEFLPLAELDPGAGAASAYLVPQAAHRHGYGGAFWRTELVVINPNASPLRIAVQFLPTLRDNTFAPSVARTLRPGELLDLPDVLALPEFQVAGTLGALLVRSLDGHGRCGASGCAFVALSRTYASPAGPWRDEEWLPGVAANSALRSGEKAVLSHVTHDDRVGAGVGFASWSDRPVRVVARVLDAAGATVETDVADLPPFGHSHIPLRANVEDGRVEVALEGPADGGMVVPYGSMVARRTGLPWHLLPDRTPPHRLPDGWRPPIPRTLAAR